MYLLTNHRIAKWRITSIGEFTFAKCISLQTIELPDGVISIGSTAFWDCTSLQSIELPDSVTSIDDTAFADCSNDLTLIVPANSYAEEYAKQSGLKYQIAGSAAAIPVPEGLEYEIDGTGECAIMRYTGDATELVIPNVIEGAQVTRIRAEAFRECDSLQIIDLPDSVTYIYESAFRECSALQTINLPDSVTYVSNHAFQNCSTLQTIDLPDGVTSIGYGVFFNCSSLKTIDLPDGVTTISGHAFGGCSALQSIELPDSVTSIDDNAFVNCGDDFTLIVPENTYAEEYAKQSGLFYQIVDAFEAMGLKCEIDKNGECVITNYTGDTTELVIPNAIEGVKVASIDDGAFSDCRSLQTIKLPDNVTSIGSAAFSGCSSLQTVELPNRITFIDDNAFANCSDDLTLVVYENSYAEEYAKKHKLNYQVVFSSASIPVPEGLEYKIDENGECVITDYTGDAAELVIPDVIEGAQVTSIGNYTFVGCNGLQSIHLPDGLQKIGFQAFSYCASLQSLDLPEGVTTIDSMAFAFSYNLESITIPQSVIRIAKSTFERCGSNLTLTVPPNSHAETYIKQNGLDHLLIPSMAAADPSVPAGLKYKPDGTNGYMITDYTGDAAKLVIPKRIDGKTVIRIGSAAFANCDSIQSIELPDSVTSIGDDAFDSCSSLKTIELSDSLTSIGEDAFYGCKALKTIKLPASVVHIEFDAFYDCSDDLTLIVKKNSYAENYAKKNGLKYRRK